MRFTQWLCEVLTRLSPDVTSCFRNTRTYCRDHQNTVLFQDLHKLFETPGTCLPPTLGMYALCGALLCNGGMLPQEFVEVLLPAVCHQHPSRQHTEEEAGVKRALFLRIVRDVIACFTRCAVEGIYWADMSLGASVEDQPFPLTFMPSSRVFTKDDCEGRASQVQQMVELLRQMHLVAMRIGMAAFVQEVLRMRSFAALLSGLSGATSECLLKGCCALGELFCGGQLDAQTTVGDVHFASMDSAVQSEAVGHSFGILFFRGKGVQDVCVLESTGWQRTEIPQHDRPLDALEQRVLQGAAAFLQTLHRRRGGAYPRCNMCGVMTRVVENCIYQRILLGHGCMFFTAAPIQSRGRTKKKTPAHPQYGVSLPALRRNLAHYPKEPPHEAIRVDTRAFVEALCDTETDARLHSRHHHADNLNTASGPRTAGPWPPQAGAEEMLAIYDAIQASIPGKRRCLRPPPKEERRIEQLMCAHWGPLTEADLATAATAATAAASGSPIQAGGKCRGVYLVVPGPVPPMYTDSEDANAEAESAFHQVQSYGPMMGARPLPLHVAQDGETQRITEWIRAQWPGVAVTSAPFMASRIFNVFSPL